MTGKKQFKPLNDLIDNLRAKGVTAYEGDYQLGHVKLVLLEQEPAKAPEEIKNEPVPKALGRDGLTAEEQIALYGHVKDAEK